MEKTLMTSSSVKALAESSISSIPSSFNYATKTIPASNGNENLTLEQEIQEEESIPIIDYSMLTSGDSEQRSKVVQEIGEACRDWKGFLIINHGFDEKKMQKTLDISEEFFNLKEEEKREFQGRTHMDSIMYGSSLHGNPSANVLLWRDFLKVIVHPEFNAPNKPLGFSEVIEEYSKAVREMARAICGAISESLGMDPSYIDKAMNLESAFQYFAVNFYPPCPQPELAMGLAPHTDHGLLTFDICNGVSGLQFHRNHKWVDIDVPSGTFLVNLSDQLEVLTNGKYKSCFHRAVVNKSKRFSIAMANGPAPDTVVGPLPEMVDAETKPAAYRPMRYLDYVDLLLTRRDGKIGLNHVKI